MEIASIRHKALRKFVATGNAKGVIEQARLARIPEFLVKALSFEECSAPPNFGFHPLTGDRAGTFAVTVTRSWRLTFTRVDAQTIADLDLEDYH